jgi:hypothetical protein
MLHGLATVVAKRICHDKTRQERELFGCKMTICEMIGMLLQFLLIPGQLIKENITESGGQHGVCTRFSKPIYKRRKKVKEMPLMSAYLCSAILVLHVPCSLHEKTT